ncbi:hypothetical protein [Streptomyces roseolus]|uniref:hypothetical protein n=1 Tax=Streptomyces roseolus TaxID=67358 RepID=UPI00199B517B|nr:hypothetical protein [Streptomyces roseolus]GGR42346.1 hypothetical protein GCM10010282_38940 [Streptomyces roseolus]
MRYDVSGSGFGNGGSDSGLGEEWGVRAARSRALAVLRVRGRALGAAILPAAVAVVLYAGEVTGHFTGTGWATARWTVTVLAVLVLLAAAAVALVVARARPAVTPTVELTETAAPDLHRLVRDLADRLDVPAPAAIALTPDCDSWLEDRSHRAHRQAGAAGSPVLVIGSPFLWWMRVAELRAVLAPVVAGTGPAADPDIAAARRFVRGLDAAAVVADEPGLGPLRRLGARGVGRVARLLLRACGTHAAEMERGVAAAGSERAQAVDQGTRIIAQEQVGLAYAGWDRLLTRVALPAWRMGRWPSGLDAGVVSALTELSRRDRLAEGYSSRLGERPACDLLEEPGAVDEAASLLAARLFHGGPAEAGPDWAPVEWSRYPEEVVDRKWRADAARLHEVLDRLAAAEGPGAADAAGAPTLSRVLTHLTTAPDERPAPPPEPERPAPPEPEPPVLAEDEDGPLPAADEDDDPVPAEDEVRNPAADTLAAALSARVAREDAEREARVTAGAGFSGPDGPWPLCPLVPPRTGRDLLADHVTALVCCAAVDTTGAAPGLDWLDGPALLVDGVRATDLAPRVLALVEDGDPAPLRAWLAMTGVRPEKPVRLL